jgi:hypothetical protein
MDVPKGRHPPGVVGRVHTSRGSVVLGQFADMDW